MLKQEGNNRESGQRDYLDLNLEPRIYDFTQQTREYLVNDVPLSEEHQQVLRLFERRHTIGEVVEERGRDRVVEELDEASKYFDFTQAQQAVKEGLSLAQKINPDVPIKAFPIVFLFMPRYGDAKALHGQGCAININALKPTKVSNDTSYQKIVSYVAHESTHLFLKQLDKKTPPFSIRTDPLDKGIYDFLWEEGLTTYVEPTHYRHHEGFVQDAKFWINTVESWLKAENALVKERILKDCTKREATISWFEDMSSSKEAPNLDGLNEQELDLMFLRMLTEMNGPAYHVGSYLWKKQIDKGKALKDLVMLGSGEMKKWIQEEQ
jgi:hypothetical protein